MSWPKDETTRNLKRLKYFIERRIYQNRYTQQHEEDSDYSTLFTISHELLNRDVSFKGYVPKRAPA